MPMLFFIFVFSSLHISGHDDDRASFISIPDFEFYEDGIFKVSAITNGDSLDLSVRFVLFTEKEYVQ
jgi:hypothetical protein